MSKRKIPDLGENWGKGVDANGLNIEEMFDVIALRKTVSALRQELEKLRADTVTEVCDWIAQEVGTGVGRLVREHFAAPSPSLADKEINEEIANQSDQ